MNMNLGMISICVISKRETLALLYTQGIMTTVMIGRQLRRVSIFMYILFIELYILQLPPTVCDLLLFSA